MRERVGLSLEFDLRNVTEELNEVARRLLDPERPMQRLGAHMTRRIKKSMPSGGGEPSSIGGFPHSQRGARGLRGTIHDQVLTKDKQLEVGSTAIYADVINVGTDEALGGPIRPKYSETLAIPMTKRARSRSPRDFKNLQWRPNTDPGPVSRGVLGQVRGGKFILLYALVEEVDIEERPFLEFVPSDEDFALKVFIEELAREDN